MEGVDRSTTARPTDPGGSVPRQGPGRGLADGRRGASGFLPRRRGWPPCARSSVVVAGHDSSVPEARIAATWRSTNRIPRAAAGTGVAGALEPQGLRSKLCGHQASGCPTTAGQSGPATGRPSRVDDPALTEPVSQTPPRDAAMRTPASTRNDRPHATADGSRGPAAHQGQARLRRTARQRRTQLPGSSQHTPAGATGP